MHSMVVGALDLAPRWRRATSTTLRAVPLPILGRNSQ